MTESSAIARYIAEFIGTFILVFTIGCCVLTRNDVWGGVSIGCVLAALISVLGMSSGGNFNPAVSVAFGLTGNLPWLDVGVYIVVQTIAGIMGAFAYVWFFWDSFDLAPTPGNEWWEAALAEMLYTCMLCFVALNVATSKPHAEKSYFCGVSVGAVIVAGAYGGGTLSMGCFNPAVAVGIDVSSSKKGFSYCLIYSMFEFAGCFAAVILFWLVRPDEAEKAGLSLPVAHADGLAKPPYYPMVSKLLAEIVGTFTLALTAGLSMLSLSKVGNLPVAAALLSMAFALHSVSGAHFNPAVTVGVMAAGRDAIQPCQGLVYIVVQIVGGCLGSITSMQMMDRRSFELRPQTSSWDRVFGAELLFTFLLVLVSITVLTTDVGVRKLRANPLGITLGVCVVSSGVAVGSISRAVLNPALAIGFSLIHLSDDGVFWPCLVYSVTELVAGLLAAAVFCCTHPSEFDSESESETETVLDDGVRFFVG
eukprot:TRINITY_DN40213_c0_g1_i1.p1 TRINITY_DN40213_c0_g1~~TRINITY_DN40213_c0_g1_i1.p1  ORF type:complete len:478 (-),score=77.98 TRINITY_DN40213_c0_g1_i1:76-1509(-)